MSPALLPVIGGLVAFATALVKALGRPRPSRTDELLAELLLRFEACHAKQE